MIVLVIEGLIDAEVDVDIDKLLVNEGDVLLEVEVDGDIDDDVEALADGLGVTEWDGDRELLLEAVGEMLWLPDEVVVGVGGGVIVLVIDGLIDSEEEVDADMLVDVESEKVCEEDGENDTDDDVEPLVE